MTFYGGPGEPNGTLVEINETLVPGAAIDVDGVVLPDQYSVQVETKDGRKRTQSAYVGREATGAWDDINAKAFIFRDVDPSDVDHILMTNSKGTCQVDGNP